MASPSPDGTEYQGQYSTWKEAKLASKGYESDEILDKAVAATRAVRDGKAAWERDTVLFDEPSINEPLLNVLRRVAAENKKRLSVLDFGGALGSAWWQNRHALVDLNEVRWSVVEQGGFVAAGRREFTNSVLRFYENVDACLWAETPNVVVMSSVLPYLERPHDCLAEMSNGPWRDIVIDRNGLTRGGPDRLTVQTVPTEIYDASYPCWFFNRARLLRGLNSDWEVVSEWPTIDGEGRSFVSWGLHMRKRTTEESKSW
ncbi:MAG: methyltransferase, TIGR04325 family [Candidatus Synoicihabitans palmerolidicus]|nr:methyltransferase, TIGR04325 family [Candidatus Synoicihabitans palmerolidicus]